MSANYIQGWLSNNNHFDMFDRNDPANIFSPVCRINGRRMLIPAQLDQLTMSVFEVLLAPYQQKPLDQEDLWIMQNSLKESLGLGYVYLRPGLGHAQGAIRAIQRVNIPNIIKVIPLLAYTQRDQILAKAEEVNPSYLFTWPKQSS